MAKNLKTLDIVQIAMFAAIMAICSWISIPTAVPFTLQTLGLFMCIGMLGGKKGSIAVAIYLLLGLMGVPVFASFTGGIGVFVGPNGGYLIGFLLASLTMWLMEKLPNSSLRLPLSMAIGQIICYAVGSFWYVSIYIKSTGEVGFLSALSTCVLPYVIPDMLKIALALLLCKRINLKESDS